MAFYMTSSKSFFDQCPFMRRVEGPQWVESGGLRFSKPMAGFGHTGVIGAGSR
jgi:hypothetical protein